MRVQIASSREPNGVTWLVNALLAVNIRTERISKKPMWIPHHDIDKYILSEHESHLQRWLPILQEQDVFEFDSNIRVIWSHELPRKSVNSDATILFVRNPKDAIFSRYKRENVKVSFEKYLDFIDEETLLSKIDSWNLFYSTWLQEKEIKIVTFEFMKKYEREFFKEILQFINVSRNNEEIDYALEMSKFERAKKTEIKFLKSQKKKTSPIIRAGIANEWLENREEIRTFQKIESQTSEVWDALQSYTHHRDLQIKIECNWVVILKNLRFLRILKSFPKAERITRFGTLINSVNARINEASLNKIQKYELKVWIWFAARLHKILGYV